jgi:hypothetical protein
LPAEKVPQHPGAVVSRNAHQARTKAAGESDASNRSGMGSRIGEVWSRF